MDLADDGEKDANSPPSKEASDIGALAPAISWGLGVAEVGASAAEFLGFVWNSGDAGREGLYPFGDKKFTFAITQVIYLRKAPAYTHSGCK